MLKLHLGYLNINGRIYFIIKYSNMQESLREKGRIFNSNDLDIFNIISMYHPALNIRDNVLFLPGSIKTYDKDIILLIVDITHRMFNQVPIIYKINILFNKINNTVRNYNNSLSNKELKNGKKIILEYISSLEILRIEKETISEIYPDKNINSIISPYFELNIDTISLITS